MTATFEPDREPSFARYREQWEAGLLAQAIAENADLPPGHRKGVLRAWFSARYNAASFHIVDGPCHPGAGDLAWLPAGPAAVRPGLPRPLRRGLPACPRLPPARRLVGGPGHRWRAG